jgi:serine/threonine-protein kinase
MKFRRHLPQSSYWRSLLKKDTPEFKQHAREFELSLKHLAIFLGALLLGYLMAAFFLFRAPIFAQTSSVPRVIGYTADSARALLQKSGLAGKIADHVTHPTIAQGRVVWQDPPADVLVTAGTAIDLAISDGPQRVLIPDVAGYDEDTARLLMESAGLTVTIEHTQTSAPKGVVVNSRPPSGTALNPGRPVALVVSEGAPTITVPDVVGLTLEDARPKIEDAGFRIGTTFTRSTTVAQPGTIIEQRPQAGTLGAPGTAVNLFIARQAQ